MKLTVTGRHLKITDGIREHLDKAIARHVTPFVEGPGDIHVCLSVEKERHDAEITVKSKGFSAHAQHETHDLYSAIDGVVQKIEKQLKKHKERLITLKNKKSAQVKQQSS